MLGDGFGSFSQWRRRWRTEDDCRAFLEALVWPQGPFCPHCGATCVHRFPRHPKRRAGLFHCRDCRGQFTVTTKTPLHGTKLPLAVWLHAFYLVLGSSKGISSVVLARVLGVSQKTAWKMGHALREFFAAHYESLSKLVGTVEVDTFFTGGPPKPHDHRFKYAYIPPKVNKTAVLVAKARGGKARAVVVAGESAAELGKALQEVVDPKATLMSDSGKGLVAAGKVFSKHQTVNHKRKEYAKGKVHANTVEALGGILQRAVFGVYHKLSPGHLQRYLDEMGFRWSHRWVVTVTGKNGRPMRRLISTPFDEQLKELLRHAVGQELRYSAVGGIRKPAGAKRPRARTASAERAPDPDEIPF